MFILHLGKHQNLIKGMDIQPFVPKNLGKGLRFEPVALLLRN